MTVNEDSAPAAAASTGMPSADRAMLPKDIV